MESVAKGGSYNFRPLEGWQLDPANLPFEGPGLSAFALEDGVVHHTYSAYSRGVDALWTMWQTPTAPVHHKWMLTNRNPAGH